MRLRSGQPCALSYHSSGTQEYRLSIPVFRNTGSRRSRSGARPNKSLTRSITSSWSSGYGGTAVAAARRRGTANIENTLLLRKMIATSLRRWSVPYRSGLWLRRLGTESSHDSLLERRVTSELVSEIL